jgi:transcriptional regulator with XRE-family HTH domain
MAHVIRKASDIGGIIRAARKVHQLRQNDAAGGVGVSEWFMVKAEQGSDSVQWGKLFQILDGLGVRITMDIPDANEHLVEVELARALRSAERRRRKRSDAARSADADETPGEPQ